MNLAARFDELAGADLVVLGGGDGEVVVGAHFDLAVEVGGAVFLGLHFRVAVGFDGVVAFVADADLLVVLDVLVPVALGVDVDLLGTLAVFDAEFVVAAATRAAQGLEQAAGLVRGQLVGHHMLGVVEATGDQGLVGVALQEGHQHFHAYPRDGHAAVGIAGPVGGHTQPAAGGVIADAVAVPVELHFHPPVLVAVDLFAGWAGDDGGLAAQDLGLGMFEQRAIGNVPGRGDEAVAVALLEAVTRLGVAGDRLFQHLRLLALVDDFAQQPEVVPLFTRVAGQRQEVAAGQVGVALALGELVVAAQALQAALGQVLAAGAIGEASGIVVDLQRRGELAAVVRLHLQFGLLEVVVAPGGLSAACFHAHAEDADHFVVGGEAAVLLVVQRIELGEDAGVIAKHQHMAVLAVLEVEADPFFLAQALDETQVALVVLGAVDALGVDVGAELHAVVGTVQQAVFFEYGGDDLRGSQVLEDALVEAVAQVGQAGAQVDVVARQALAGVALGDAMNDAVDTLVARAEGQVGGLVDQLVEVEVGTRADQLDIETVGLVEHFPASEREHLQVAFDGGNGEGDMRLVGIQHGGFLP